MIPINIQVNGRPAKLFREGPPPVYVMPDGKFVVEWGSRMVTRPTLKGIDKVINAGNPTLKIFSVSNSRSFPSRATQTVEAAQFLENRIINKDGKRVWKVYENWYIFDQKIVDRLAKLQAKHEKVAEQLTAEFDKIMENAQRVETYSFKNLLKGDLTDDAAAGKEE